LGNDLVRSVQPIFVQVGNRSLGIIGWGFICWGLTKPGFIRLGVVGEVDLSRAPWAEGRG
jgi:hypothetical protein